MTAAMSQMKRAAITARRVNKYFVASALVIAGRATHHFVVAVYPSVRRVKSQHAKAVYQNAAIVMKVCVYRV